MSYKSGYIFDCDDCSYRRFYSSIDAAKLDGWAVSRDRKHCYCTHCALRHRYVGCSGVKK